MTDLMGIQSNIQLLRTLSNDLAGYLYSLPDEVWRDARSYGSGCEQWNIADVVSHLILESQANYQSIERALKGQTSPPMGYHHLKGEEYLERVISVRIAFHEDVFPEFNTSCRRLNTLIASLNPEAYRDPAWHSRTIMPISRLIEHRILELALHGRDIEYGFNRQAQLNTRVESFLKKTMKSWLSIMFRSSTRLTVPIIYRFDLTDSPEDGHDIVINGEEFNIMPSTQNTATVTFHLSTNVYILFLMSRLPFSRSVRRGYLTFDGEERIASEFNNWFIPL